MQMRLGLFCFKAKGLSESDSMGARLVKFLERVDTLPFLAEVAARLRERLRRLMQSGKRLARNRLKGGRRTGCVTLSGRGFGMLTGWIRARRPWGMPMWTARRFTPKSQGRRRLRRRRNSANWQPFS